MANRPAETVKVEPPLVQALASSSTAHTGQVPFGISTSVRLGGASLNQQQQQQYVGSLSTSSGSTSHPLPSPADRHASNRAVAMTRRTILRYTMQAQVVKDITKKATLRHRTLLRNLWSVGGGREGGVKKRPIRMD